MEGYRRGVGGNGHLTLLSLETEVKERTEMTFLTMRIFIINRLETMRFSTEEKAVIEMNFGSFPPNEKPDERKEI